MIPRLRHAAALTLGLALPVGLAALATPIPPAPPAEAARPDEELTSTYCDARAVVQETLRHDFAESPRLAALTGTGMTMELWTSDLLGTWTVVHHGGDGITCIVTSGMDWASDGDPAAVLDAVLDEQVFAF